MTNAGRPEPYAFNDAIDSALLSAEDSGDKQDVYNTLDTDYYVYKIVMNYGK